MADDLTPLEAMTKRAIADKEAKPKVRRASEVIGTDETLQTFSVRLTTRDIVRLRANARNEGVSASDLLRQVLQQGLDRLESRRQKRLDPAKQERVMSEIIRLVESLQDEPAGFPSQRAAGA